MENPDSEIPRLGAWRRNLTRLLFLVVVVIATHYLLSWTQALSQNNPNLMIGALILLFLAYIVLMAIPFVPGIEIGIALMLLEGRDIVVWVYFATVLGLMLSFLVGHLLPLSYLHKVFADLRLKRACLLIERIQSTPKKRRLDIFNPHIPKFLHPVFIHGRYILIALVLNIPGNALLGGGGGILLVAGLCRIFHPWLIFATLLIAVAPIPFSILILGFDPLSILSK